MENFKKISLVAVLMAFSAYIFFQERQGSENTTAHLNEGQKPSSLEASFDGTGLDPKNLRKSFAFQRQSDSDYLRPQHKKRITAQDVSRVLDMSYDESDFSKLAVEYEQRPRQSTVSEQVWDLNQKPETHEQMQLYLKELRYALLAEVEDAVVSKDRKRALKFAGLHFGYTFLSVFEFKGYDEEGVALIELPKDLADIYAAAINKDKVKKTASVSKVNKLSKQKRSVAQADEDILQALHDQSISQVTYFEDPNNEGYVDPSYTRNGSKFAALTELMEGLIARMESYDSFNIFKSAQELHEANQKLIKTTMGDMRTYPQRYIHKYQKESIVVNDVTDADFTIYADSLLRTESLKYALAGAALNIAVNAFSGGTFLKTNPIFKGVSLLGEGLITALGCYQGAKSMILLQRFYTFMHDKKETFRRTGKDFFPKQATEEFDADRVYESAGMRRELNKAWAWGLVWGLANKFNLATRSYRSIVAISGRALGLAVDGLFKMYGSSNLIVSIVGKIGIHAGLGISTVKGFLEHAIGKASLKNIPFLGKFFKYTIEGFKKIPGASRVVASLVDAGITGVFVYASVYTRLSSTKALLDRVHYSPEVSIYLSLDSVNSDEGETFLEATRRHFYPVCHFFATRVNNFERETVLNEEQSDVKAQKDRRIKSCLRSIATFEGVAFKDVQSKLLDLSEGDLDMVHDIYFKDVSPLTPKITASLRSIQKDYPSHYRTVWVAALKAVYNLDQVPDEFYLYKDLLILGKQNSLNEFFEEYISMSAHKSAEQIGVDRFTYTVERLTLKANELKASKNLESTEVVERVSPAEAFAAYWNHHKNLKDSTDQDIKELFTQKEFSWWRKVWNGADEAVRGLKWMWDDMRLSVGHKTFSFTANSEIETILKGF